MLKTRVLLLSAALCLAILALAPLTGAHSTPGQERSVNGYTIVFKTDPGEPVTGKATTLEFSFLCTENKAHVAGNMALEVSAGETSELQKTQAVAAGAESAKVTKTFDTTGPRTVNVAFTPQDASACAGATGGAADASFSMNVGEPSFLPAPGAFGLLGALVATALLLRVKREP